MRPMWLAVLALSLAGTRADAQDRSYESPEAVANAKVAWADVLRVDPVYETVRNRAPREVCEEYPVERRGDDGSKATGAVIGAIVGGVLGNTVGKGDGRKAATIGGAVIGAIIGNNIDRNNGSRDGQYQYRDQAGTVRRCRTVTDYDAQDRWSGYDVTYRYGGRTYRAVTNYRPGPTIRVAVEVRPIDEGVAYRR